MTDKRLERELEDLREKIWDEESPRKVKRLQKKFRQLERIVFPEKFDPFDDDDDSDD